MDRRQVDAAPRRTESVSVAHERLRSSSGFMAEEERVRIIELSRTGRADRRLRPQNEFYARGIPARLRARLLSVMGVSGHRLLLDDQPLWDAGRIPVPG